MILLLTDVLRQRFPVFFIFAYNFQKDVKMVDAIPLQVSYNRFGNTGNRRILSIGNCDAEVQGYGKKLEVVSD